MKKNVLVLLSASYQKKYLPKESEHYVYLAQAFDSKSFPKKIANDITKRYQNKKIDGVFGVNDRSSAIASLVAEELGLLGASPNSVAKAQHKAISLKIFQAISDTALSFKYFDIKSINSVENFSYPAFYRPVKGFLSRDSGFAQSFTDLKQKIENISRTDREYISWFNNFFSVAISKYQNLSGFILEPAISGKQITVDGYVQNNTVQISALSESIQRADVYSFDRFELPMEISKKIRKKILDFLEKFVKHIEYDNSAFNAEFFITEDEKIVPIEFNTRLSLQFEPMLSATLNRKYFEILADVSCGKSVEFTEKNDEIFATCFILRKINDAFVARIPKRNELEKIKENYSSVHEISLYCKKNKRLSDMLQDAYSYRYAGITIVGKNREEVKKSFERVKKELEYLFEFK